jgi:hypothetical protein
MRTPQPLSRYPDVSEGVIMLTINDFISRLENVKVTRQDQWMANCPAHDCNQTRSAVFDHASGFRRVAGTHDTARG